MTRHRHRTAAACLCSATLPRMLLGAAVALASGHAGAAQCSISAQSVSFGIYDVFDNAHLDGVGNLSLTCDAPTAYSISLSPGSGAYSSRVMRNGIHALHYNLFADPARTSVWGDGSGGSTVVNGAVQISTHHPVYGRINARQNVFAGNYSDTLTVIVDF